MCADKSLHIPINPTIFQGNQITTDAFMGEETFSINLSRCTLVINKR